MPSGTAAARGIAALRRGQSEQAIQELGRAVQQTTQLGDPREQAASRAWLGAALLERDPRGARHQLRIAHALWVEHGLEALEPLLGPLATLTGIDHAIPNTSTRDPELTVLAAAARLAESVERADTVAAYTRMAQARDRMPAAAAWTAPWIQVACRAAGITELVVRQGTPLLLDRSNNIAYTGARVLCSLKRSKTLFRLLEHIALHGRPAPVEELFTSVWEERWNPPSTLSKLRMAVARLRKSLSTKCIVTARGGYAISPPRTVATIAPGPLAAATPTDRPFDDDQTTFVGRDRLLEAVGRRLHFHRWVTLTGAPGVGKTRLARRALDRAGGRAGWVGLCDLDQRRTMSEILAAIGLAMGHRQPVPRRQILADLARRGQSILLLDNAESAATALAGLAPDVLRSCPDLTVLVTSRRAIRVAPEQIMVVEPLPIDADLSAPSTDEALRARHRRLLEKLSPPPNSQRRRELALSA